MESEEEEEVEKEGKERLCEKEEKDKTEFTNTEINFQVLEFIYRTHFDYYEL